MTYKDYINKQVEEIYKYYNKLLQEGRKDISLERAAFEWITKYAEQFSRQYEKVLEN